MKLAAKLDTSPAIVWNWRQLWRFRSVQINAIGALLNLLIGAAIWVSPVLGVIWMSPIAAASVGLGLILSGILFAAAVVARFLTQPDVPTATPATPPGYEDDNSEHC